MKIELQELSRFTHLKNYATPTWVRPVIAIGLTLIGVAVSTFGLTGLIAKGYGTVCWGFLIVYVIPMLTIGIYKISKAGK